MLTYVNFVTIAVNVLMVKQMNRMKREAPPAPPAAPPEEIILLRQIRDGVAVRK